MSVTRCSSVVALVAGAIALAQPAQSRSAVCDPAFVHTDGAVVTVAPNGSNDTANLQCAIDLASTLGRGSLVQLLSGTYRTHQLVVEHLRGAIRGAGRDATTVQNAATPLPVVNPVTWIDAPPSSANPYPTLISIIGDEVVMSDMSIRIVGVDPTDPWFFVGAGPFRFVVPALAVVGSHMAFTGQRLAIGGSDICFPEPQSNLLVGFELWNFASRVTPRVTGTRVAFDDARFDGCAGIFFDETDDAEVVVTRNEFETRRNGVQFGGLTNSRVEIAHSRFARSSVGIDVEQGNFASGIHDSSLLFRNNRFESVIGVRVRRFEGVPTDKPFFQGDVPCAMVGNNVASTDTGYWFGLGTYGCTVAGAGNAAAIDETGGLNTITGSGSVSGGVGHMIAPRCASPARAYSFWRLPRVRHHRAGVDRDRPWRRSRPRRRFNRGPLHEILSVCTRLAPRGLRVFDGM